MTKGKRRTRYNLRQRIRAPTSSGKRKRKQIVHHADCPCPPGYFNSKTGFCRCACHLQDNTDPHHEPCGSPRQSNSPSILQHEYITILDQEAAAQAGQPCPSTSFREAENADSGSSSENESDNEEDETTSLIPSAHKTKVIIQPEKEIEKESTLTRSLLPPDTVLAKKV